MCCAGKDVKFVTVSMSHFCFTADSDELLAALYRHLRTSYVLLQAYYATLHPFPPLKRP